MLTPQPARVRCLGPDCTREFLSRDRRSNRLCADCTRKLKRLRADRVYPATIFVNGRQVPPPD
jgi:hypothetical protein